MYCFVKGYPEKYENNIIINIENVNLKENQFLYHAGTKQDGKNILSNGGRVLNIVARSKDFKSARDQTLIVLDKINWSNGFYRKDIGHKVIDS